MRKLRYISLVTGVTFSRLLQQWFVPRNNLAGRAQIHFQHLYFQFQLTQNDAWWMTQICQLCKCFLRDMDSHELWQLMTILHFRNFSEAWGRGLSVHCAWTFCIWWSHWISFLTIFIYFIITEIFILFNTKLNWMNWNHNHRKLVNLHGK